MVTRAKIAQFAVVILAVMAAGFARAETPPVAETDAISGSAAPSAPDDLAARAMTILKNNCFACHNKRKHKNDLQLISREAILKGGQEGPAIVEGKAEESLLANMIRPDNDPHMPPDEQLSDEDIAALRAWIDRGAPWDDEALKRKPAGAEPLDLASLPEAYRPVMALALSADETKLAAGRGQRIFVYDVGDPNRPIVSRLEGHRDAVQSLAWSPDGQALASGGYERILLRKQGSAEPALEITKLVGRVTALLFTPDGATLISADGEVTSSGMIRLWSVENGEQTAAWQAHKDTIFDLKLIHEGKTLVTASADNLVKLWNMETRETLGTFEGHTGHVLALATNPDETLLATGSADHDIKVWNFETHQQKTTIGSHPGAVTALAWTAEGNMIISACEDGAVRLSNDSETRHKKTMDTADDLLYCLAAAADGKTVYGGCHDGFIYVWDGEGKIQAKLSADEAPVQTASK